MSALSSLIRAALRAPRPPAPVSSIPNVVTTAKTSAQIDALVPAGYATDGSFIRDATNLLLLVRMGGKWYKSATLTLIS